MAVPVDANSSRNRVLGRAVVLLVAAVLLGAGGFLYLDRNTYRVTLRPGERASVVVEIPMQRPGRTASFAKELGLPVRCSITSPAGEADGVRVSTLATGHKLHKMWAKVEVHALIDAAPGRRRRTLEFTIDGQDGWPRAALIATVRR